MIEDLPNEWRRAGTANPSRGPSQQTQALLYNRGESAPLSRREPSAPSMNTHPSYTLTARPETGRTLRAWAVLSRGTFSGLIFLSAKGETADSGAGRIDGF